jgi:hypothetical protein
MKTTNKLSMRSIPAAAAMAAALLLGAQVHAQTNNTTTPPGSTKPNDQVQAAPNTKATARAGAEAGNSSGNPVAASATMTGGTTNPKDGVSPAPMGGTAMKDADARTAAKAQKREKRAAKKASNQAARDTAATTTGGAMAKPDGAASGGTK